MLKRFVLALFMMLFASQILAAEAVTVTAASSIDAVTVFTDRAMVKRIFSGEFPRGKVKVEIPDLPSGLLSESIRVSGRGTSGAKISAVWVETEYFEKTASEKLKRLEAELEGFKKRNKELSDRSEVLTQKKKFVENISAKTSESISSNITVQRPTAGEWAEMVNFVERELEGINAEKRLIEEENLLIADKKEIISKQLKKYNIDKTNSSKTAMIELYLDNPGRLDFNLSYLIRGASWKSVYDVRMESDINKIDMLMFANITQNTGEDWDNVHIELTTARPSLSAKPPDQRPWIIGYVEPGIHARGGRDSKNSRHIDRYVTTSEIKRKPLTNVGNAFGTTSGSATQLTDTQWAISDVKEQMISTSFVLSQRENIAGNNTPKRVSVKAVELVGATEYFANPRQGPYAYLKAKLTNKTNFPFLEGVASVFLDGNFVHSTIIPMVVPNEEFDLYLGIDDKIKVTRELVEKFTDKGGMLSRKDKLSYAFKTTVENYKKTTQKITILDQYPVSQNDQIDVKLLEVSPETNSDELDESKGFLRWVMDLNPGAKKEINFAYEIKYSGDLILYGLK